VDKTLNGLRPTAVAIPGWSDGRSLAALKWCARNSVPAVMMSESNACDNKPRVWKEVIKSRLVRLCSAGLVGGKTHADYLAQLGMPKDRVFLGYDAIDNEYFAQKSNQARTSDFQPPAANPPLRNGLPKRYFLASARFVEKKNLPRLIQAYARYRTLASEAEGGKRRATVWDLVILGDGALRSELCRLSIDLHLQECVHVPGFKQYPDLPAYYGFAGAFIHASTTEQWGLVVNEAMASGLPVLVSNRCGCASDLVREGVNGFTFDPYNIEQLARLMLQLSDVEFQLSAFGEASRKIIATWGPERFASGLKAAVTKALEVGPIKASIVEQVILNALVAK
jgi:glycosyltransferase involved in cell wall biosynthesis